MKTNNDKNAKVTEITVEPPVVKNSLLTNLRKVSLMVSLTVAVIVCASVALFTFILVMANSNSLRAAAAEYDYLRGLAGDIEIEVDSEGDVRLSELDEEMRDLNSDYVCWIRIDGTGVDYPVVRGRDNKEYIDTTFYGEQNRVGAIFMDYRNVGESIPHIIIYGHYLAQGGMFSDLRKFLDESFMEGDRIITLIVNGQNVRFQIFSARLTTINDPAYFLDFNSKRSFPRFADRINAPLHATQIITLSTCAPGSNDNQRVIVQGYRLFD